MVLVDNAEITRHANAENEKGSGLFHWRDHACCFQTARARCEREIVHREISVPMFGKQAV